MWAYHSCVQDYHRGNAYRNLGQFQQAIDDYNLAITLAPDDLSTTTIYNNLGITYAAMGEYKNAIEHFDKAIILGHNPLAPPYLNRGNAYEYLGQDDQAIADFERFLELSDDSYLREKAEDRLRELGAR